MLKRIALMMTLLVLSGCGFHLRGSTDIPFATIYLGVGDTSPVAVVLKRAIRGNGPTKVVTDPAKADIRLELLGEGVRTEILTINSLGIAAEYNLLYTLRFRVTDTKGRPYIRLTELPLKRLVIINSNATLPEVFEIQQLVSDMQSDAAQQILRRLEAIKPGVYEGPAPSEKDLPLASPMLPLAPSTPLLTPGLSQ
jgi:LPS-assembly lipoprotein